MNSRFNEYTDWTGKHVLLSKNERDMFNGSKHCLGVLVDGFTVDVELAILLSVFD